MSKASQALHREQYPEQYSHPAVGRRFTLNGRVCTIARVTQSRFGEMVNGPSIDGERVYYRLSDCQMLPTRELTTTERDELRALIDEMNADILLNKRFPKTIAVLTNTLHDAERDLAAGTVEITP